MNVSETLENLSASGNLRQIPEDRRLENIIDFSTNDYLGLASFSMDRMSSLYPELKDAPMTSSASRLLAGIQHEYNDLENELGSLYDRRALLYNSGYHANIGIISAIADRSTVVIADRLVHASIIDGVLLSRAKLMRFEHNDLDMLETMVKQNYDTGHRIVVIVESVYSMDGDSPDMNRLVELKAKYPSIILYVDEAHAFGVKGPKGLGMAMETVNPKAFDIIVMTFGKALASYGACVITSSDIREFLVNKSRSLIFSTSLPPIMAWWTKIMLDKMLTADDRRLMLNAHVDLLHKTLSQLKGSVPDKPSHIRALIIGDAQKTVEASKKLREDGLLVLPIRTPTVPAGTERLRISLSASMQPDDILKLSKALKCITD
ncbi:MAG: 8-amino-7-oxononanoate synthase [Muribaculaceae bacterium]|nr:8-amino-7-oxononanoate synthase [Muribaculaceae bacterium]